MKKVDAVKIRDADGVTMVPADTFFRWKKVIAGAEFEFALHAEPKATPPRTLYISETSTGCTTRISPMHSKYRKPLTEAAFNKKHATYTPGADIKRIARSALHSALVHMGHEKFVEAIGMANLQIMAASARDLHSELKQVGLGLIADEGDKLEALIEQRRLLQEQWDVTSKSPEELNELDAQLAVIDDQIAQVHRAEKLVTMRARLDALTEQREQHGTMTGDTAEQDFEEICDNIATLECEIAELEGDHAVVKPD